MKWAAPEQALYRVTASLRTKLSLMPWRQLHKMPLAVWLMEHRQDLLLAVANMMILAGQMARLL